MTRRRLTCFSWIALCGIPVILPAATVTGSVAVTAAAHAHADDADIVIWLQGLHEVAETKPGRAQLLQENKMFHPHVLAVRTGTVIDFPNADPIFHNAFSNYDGQLFDVGLYPPGSSRSIRFRRPGIVRVFCNIHPSMSAVILVLNTPYFTHVRSDGQFRLTDVPEGEYRLHAFDERAADPGDLGPVLVSGEAGEVAAPAVHLSESGYVQRAHKNKYGRDYPLSASEDRPYGGVAQ